MYDAENNKIDREYFEKSIREAINKRPGRMVTRRKQKEMEKSYTFYYKVNIDGNNEPMESHSLGPHDYQLDTSNDNLELNYEYDSLEAEVDKHFSPIPPPSDGKVTVKFRNVDDFENLFEFTCERTERLSDILTRFAADIENNVVNRFEFFKEDNSLVDMMSSDDLETILDENMDIIQIDFRINEPPEYESSPPRKQSVTEPMITDDGDDKIENKNLYLRFIDEMNNNDPMELTYTGEENMVTALKNISQVMELNESNVHFYDSHGE